MKQISARKFRLGFTKLTEPVTVVTFVEEEVRPIGTWTPFVSTDAHLQSLAQRVLRNDELRFTPAPKPSQRPSKRGSK